MAPLPKITEAEAQIMAVLWDAPAPLAAEAVREQLDADWSEATVRTFLTRLVKKKALTQIKDGKRYLYRPLIERSAHIHAESRSLLDRLFGGQLTPLVHHFSEQGDLSREDLAKLKALIAEIEKKHG